MPRNGKEIQATKKLYVCFSFKEKYCLQLYNPVCYAHQVPCVPGEKILN